MQNKINQPMHDELASPVHQSTPQTVQQAAPAVVNKNYERIASALACVGLVAALLVMFYFKLDKDHDTATFGIGALFAGSKAIDW